MCIAVPGKVIEVYEYEALVDFAGMEKVINTFFIEEVNIGDYVLVHVGCAVEKISEELALETMEIFNSIIGE